MKKALSLILALVMCLSLCACGGSSKVTLDLNNYQQYISVSPTNSEITKGVTVGQYPNISRNTALRLSVVAEGVSTNFNYNDVIIKVRFYSSYGTTDLVSYSKAADAGTKQNFDIVLELSPNIAGSGDVVELINAPSNKALVEIDCKYQIISISGTVTPA